MTYPQPGDDQSPHNLTPPAVPPDGVPPYGVLPDGRGATARWPLTPAVRQAIARGPLSAALLVSLQRQAEERQTHVLALLTLIELSHLQLVKHALPVGATWEDALAAFQQAAQTDGDRS